MDVKVAASYFSKQVSNCQGRIQSSSWGPFCFFHERSFLKLLFAIRNITVWKEAIPPASRWICLWLLYHRHQKKAKPTRKLVCYLVMTCILLGYTFGLQVSNSFPNNRTILLCLDFDQCNYFRIMLDLNDARCY